MAQTIQANKNYVNPLVGARDKLSNNEWYNEEDYQNVVDGKIKGFTPDMYAYMMANTGKIQDAQKFKDDYLYDYLDSESRLAALYNEIFKEDLSQQGLDTERKRYKFDEEGNPVYYYKSDQQAVERYTASDYDYYKEVIRSTGEEAYQQKLLQDKQAAKDDMNWFLRFGSTVGGFIARFGSDVAEAFGKTATFMSSAFKAFADTVEDIGTVSPEDYFENFSKAFTMYNINDWEDNSLAELTTDFSDWVYDFESKYSLSRTVTGQDTEFVGKYLGSFVDMSAQMLTSAFIGAGIGQGISAAIAGTAITDGAYAVINSQITGPISQVAFYAPHMRDDIASGYESLIASGKGVTYSALVANVSLKAGFQIVIENQLGNVLGALGLGGASSWDAAVFKRNSTAIKSKSLLGAGVKRFLYDAFEEGLEEVLQDTSDYFVDRVFSKLVDENFGSLSELTVQGLLDSFTIAAFSSIAGTAYRSVSSYIKGNRVPGLGPIASMEYILSMEDFSDSFNNIMDILANEKNKSDEKVYKSVAKAMKSYYASYRLIMSYAKGIGQERMLAAQELLQTISENGKKGIYDLDYAQKAAKQLYDDIFAGQEEIAKFKENLEEELKNADLGQVDEVITEESIKEEQTEKEEQDATTEENISAQAYAPSESSTFFNQLKALDNSVTKVVTTETGNRPVKVENTNGTATVVIPKNMLKLGANVAVNAYTQSEIVKQFIEFARKSKDVKIGLDELYDMYKQTHKDATMEQMVCDMLFTDSDASFFRTVLPQATKDCYNALYAIASIAKSTNLKAFKHKKELFAACHRAMKSAIEEYVSYNVDAEIDGRLFTKEEIKQIRARASIRYATHKLVNYRPDKLTKEEVELITLYAKNSGVKNAVDNIFNPSAGKRDACIRDVNNAYKGRFFTKYDGTIYLTEESYLNSMFNSWLKMNDLTVRDIVTMEDKEEQDEILYSFAMYEGNANVYASVVDNTIVVRTLNHEDDWNVHYWFIPQNATKASLNNERQWADTTGVTLGNNIFDKYFSESFTKNDRELVSFDSFIKNYNTYLNDDTLSDIVAEYGELTEETVFNYFVGVLANDSNKVDGKVLTLIRKENGTIVLGNFVNYNKMFSQKSIEYMRDCIKNRRKFYLREVFPNIEGISESIGNVEVIFTGYNPGYRGAFTVDDHTIELAYDKGSVNVNEMLATLYHEIQHAVQYYNGFVLGTSPGYFCGMDDDGTFFVRWKFEEIFRKIAKDMLNYTDEAYDAMDVASKNSLIQSIAYMLYSGTGEFDANAGHSVYSIDSGTQRVYFPTIITKNGVALFNGEFISYPDSSIRRHSIEHPNIDSQVKYFNSDGLSSSYAHDRYGIKASKNDNQYTVEIPESQETFESPRDILSFVQTVISNAHDEHCDITIKYNGRTYDTKSYTDQQFELAIYAAFIANTYKEDMSSVALEYRTPVQRFDDYINSLRMKHAVTPSDQINLGKENTEGNNLKNFVKIVDGKVVRRKMPVGLATFIVHATGANQVDPELQRKIDAGTLTRADVRDYLSTKDDIDDVTFSAIRDAFFPGSYITTSKMLNDAMQEYQVAYVIMRLLNEGKFKGIDNTVQANKDLLLNTRDGAMFRKVLASIKEHPEIAKYYDKIAKDYDDIVSGKHIDNAYLKRFTMKSYDGSIASLANTAKMAISLARGNAALQTVSLDKMDSDTGLTLGDTIPSDEYERIVRDVESADKNFKDIEDRYALKKKVANTILKVFGKTTYAAELTKQLFEYIDTLKKADLKDITFSKLLKDGADIDINSMQGTSKETPTYDEVKEKEQGTASVISNNINSALTGIKKALKSDNEETTKKNIALFREKYGDIVDENLRLYPTVLKQPQTKAGVATKRLVYKDTASMQEVYDRLKQARKEASRGDFWYDSTANMLKRERELANEGTKEIVTNKAGELRSKDAEFADAVRQSEELNKNAATQEQERKQEKTEQKQEKTEQEAAPDAQRGEGYVESLKKLSEEQPLAGDTKKQTEDAMKRQKETELKEKSSAIEAKNTSDKTNKKNAKAVNTATELAKTKKKREEKEIRYRKRLENAKPKTVYEDKPEMERFTPKDAGDLVTTKYDKVKFGNKKIQLIKIKGSSIRVASNVKLPAKLKKILEFSFEDTAKSTTKYLTNTDDYHWRASVQDFMNANSNLILALNQADFDEIADFYISSTTIDIADPEAARKYLAVQTYMTAIMLRMQEKNEITLTKERIAGLKDRLESWISIGMSSGATYHSITSYLNPFADMMKASAQRYGINPREEDLLALQKAIEKQDVNAYNEACRNLYQHMVEDREKQLGTHDRSIFDKILSWQKTAMLSGPGTWIRNIASNVVLNGVDVKVGGKEYHIQGLNEAGASLGDKIVNGLRKLIPKFNTAQRITAMRELINKKGDFTQQELAKISKYFKAMKVDPNLVVEFSKDPNSENSRMIMNEQLKWLSKAADTQYKISSTKIDDKVKNYLNKTFVENGFIHMLLKDMTKYDPRKASTDNPISNDIAVLIAEKLALSVFYGNGIDDNVKLKDMLKAIKNSKSFKEFSQKSFNTFQVFVMKMMSDDRSMQRTMLRYMGKMLTEDKIDVDAEMKKFQDTGVLSHEILEYLSDAYVMAAWDHMHKSNFWNTVEAKIRRDHGDAAYFVYKQIFPFASASWNWFVESIKIGPYGLVSGLIKLGKLEASIDDLYEKRRTGSDQAPSYRFAEYMIKRDIGRGLIGSVATLAGMLLAAFGFVKLNEDKDKYMLSFGDGAFMVDITNIFGTQPIYIGMSIIGSIKDAEGESFDFLKTLSVALTAIAEDNAIGNLYNTWRYNNTLGDWLMTIPEQTLTMAIPNLIGTIAIFNNNKVKYEEGILGKLERLMLKAFPLYADKPFLSYYMDPYTGERQVTYSGPYIANVLTNTVNKLTPINIYPYRVSAAEKEAISLGVRKSQLTGNYKVNDEDVTLTARQVQMLNEFYGTLNKKQLAKLFNNKVKYTVQDKKGKNVDLYYRQMNDKQKAAAIKQVMSKNSDYSKIYILTSTGKYKYYASESQYKELASLGVRQNVYRATTNAHGFVKR